MDDKTEFLDRLIKVEEQIRDTRKVHALLSAEFLERIEKLEKNILKKSNAKNVLPSMYWIPAVLSLFEADIKKNKHPTVKRELMFKNACNELAFFRGWLTGLEK